MQLDLVAAPAATPSGNCTVTIEGVDFTSLQQSVQYAGMDIVVSGGMTQGLPLVTPSQRGVLLHGSIYQSFGNWVGTDMNLNFVIVYGGNTFENPGNFVLNWPAGTPLSTALANTLNVAYPGYARVMNIKNYVNSFPVLHQVPTLHTLNTMLKSLTKSATSPGVDISLLNTDTLFVADGSVLTPAVQLNFIDLIGQPQWLGGDPTSGGYIMQFTTVMRADIQVYSYVMMPKGLFYTPGIVTTNAGANPLGQLKLQSAFQGPFRITAVRHIGNFRDPNGASWATVFKAVTALPESEL